MFFYDQPHGPVQQPSRRSQHSAIARSAHEVIDAISHMPIIDVLERYRDWAINMAENIHSGLGYSGKYKIHIYDTKIREALAAKLNSSNRRNPYRRNTDENLRDLERRWKSTRYEDWEAYRRALDRAGMDICEECEASVFKDTIDECECTTPMCSSCAIKCNNCDELRCPGCAIACEGCNHKHILCDHGCNDDDEFMRKCDECDNWYCRQCADDCFHEHEDDCYG